MRWHHSICNLAGLAVSLSALINLPLMAQTISGSPTKATVIVKESPLAALQSGNAFLSDDLRRMQADASLNPVQLWVDQGHQLWGTSPQTGSCFSCHGDVQKLKGVASRYPQWSEKKQGLVNLEDQILTCTQRTNAPQTSLENPDVLALSAVLHAASSGLSFQLDPLQKNKEQ
jgi:sulfur-oxidizing protein SoxA